ncbi:hypothetical protein H0264_27530 [Nocardia huaxiensis]|uniref:Uncharacterized protein n=1 Tax=Nocardia huaxiensis TaxID=2755382 RepID=A0A7D6V6X6_9NOCA|nr:hypothetical protein [Nocardia huaxiensis]QLY29041.1 hypothetical protein H0264_27530 [Nocardia huaxiensis]
MSTPLRTGLAAIAIATALTAMAGHATAETESGGTGSIASATGSADTASSSLAALPTTLLCALLTSSAESPWLCGNWPTSN